MFARKTATLGRGSPLHYNQLSSELFRTDTWEQFKTGFPSYRPPDDVTPVLGRQVFNAEFGHNVVGSS